MSAYSLAQLQSFWVSAGGDPAHALLAASVAQAEQGSNPQVANWDVDGYSYGPWQIHYTNVPGLISAGIIAQADDLLNPQTNAEAAVYISGNGKNWSPWSTCDGTIGCTAGPAYANFVANHGRSSGGNQTAPNADPYSAVGALEAAGEFLVGGVETLGKDILGAAASTVEGGLFGPLKFTAGAIATATNIVENFGPFAIAILLVLVGGMMLAQAHRDEFNKAHERIADGVNTIGGAISKIAGEAVEVAPEVAAAGAAAAVVAL